MKLFLLRHALANNGMPDEARQLCSIGLAQVERVCGYLNKGMFSSVAQIWHSPLVRACQTAILFKEGMSLSAPLVELGNLRPIDDAKESARDIAAISAFGGDLVIVGHNPHLQELSDILLSNESRYCKTRFANCSIACFELEQMPNIEKEFGVWSLTFLISPNELI